MRMETYDRGLAKMLIPRKASSPVEWQPNRELIPRGCIPFDRGASFLLTRAGKGFPALLLTFKARALWERNWPNRRGCFVRVLRCTLVVFHVKSSSLSLRPFHSLEAMAIPKFNSWVTSN